MQISFYGGINEIGGNKILLDDQDTKIFLDFGKSYKGLSFYFEQYLQPRVVHGIKDYLSLGLIPELNGVYREDLIDILQKDNYTKLSHQPPIVDGVLISHGHLDHVGYIAFLDKRIPLYGSALTHLALKALQTTRPYTFENEILQFKPRTKKQDKKHKNKVIVEKSAIIKRDYNITQDRKPFKIKNLTIVPYDVDHSIPGAQMFVIKTSIGNILYTGDFRAYCTQEEYFWQQMSAIKKQNIQIMICEGTRIKDDHKVSEKEVFNEAYKILQNKKGLILVDSSPTDLNRFNTLCELSQKLNRTLVIQPSHYYYLQFFNNNNYPIPGFDKIFVYARQKCSIRQWEQETLDLDNVITADDISNNQKQYMLIINFYQIQELIDINPIKGSYFLRSTTEPHSEEMELSEERFKNWIKFFGMKFPQRAHASGHISGPELKQVVEFINPKTLIPIHTEYPKIFQQFHKNVKIVKPNETVYL